MAIILVIDDSKMSRNMIIKAVRALGHETLEAENGQIGLEMLMKHKPDVVTVDMLMPVMNGIEFLSAIRKDNNQTPVIVITADIQEETRRECEEFDVHFLNKPFKEQELIAALSVAAKVKGKADEIKSR
ncbi:MAG: response regulator [candidate division Zixibacteria bacterium]|nr:response regulator [candidate division Zixibacteria bacterium]